LNELQPDEEVVVIDGNSTDGSKEYLLTLYMEGKIHQYISEADKNQAHAWNKAMLMAKGTIIKKIIDDDVFCYDAIRKCKDFMLANPVVDVVISNDLGSSLQDYKNIQKLSRLRQFEKWIEGLVPSFTFGDVHMLIRKSALAYIGLYNTGYVMMDWEYSLRISYLRAKVTYYTGYNALSVAHPHSITSLKNERLTEEQGKRGCVFYEYKGDRAEISLWSKIKIEIGKRIKKKRTTNTKEIDATNEDINLVYKYYYDYISELNNSDDYFIFQKK
jgi:glycosyltransferase involved in cell wall biosynthesis